MADDERFLRLPDVLTRVGFAKSKVYAMIDRGEFPKPVKIGRASIWMNSHVTEWMRQQVAA